MEKKEVDGPLCTFVESINLEQIAEDVKSGKINVDEAVQYLKESKDQEIINAIRNKNSLMSPEHKELVDKIVKDIETMPDEEFLKMIDKAKDMSADPLLGLPVVVETLLNRMESNFVTHKVEKEDIETMANIRLQLKRVAKNLILVCPQGRELSLALTKIEEAMFFANAAVSRQRPVSAE